METRRRADEAYEQLRIRLEQQEMISEISKSFLSSGDSVAIINDALAKFGSYLQVDRVLSFGIDYERQDTYLAYSWYSESAPPPKPTFPKLINLITSILPENLHESFAAPAIQCPDVTADPQSPFHELTSVDIRAFICAPLYVKGHLWGIISVEQCDGAREWTDNEISYITMTASIISGAIMRDVYNSKLELALRDMTAASKAKGEFLSNMSHEMRTPLNAIIGMTNIGKAAKSQERKNYALSKIEDASSHLLGVINDVLDMSKIEANMLELSPVEFNFDRMLQRVVTFINFRVDEKLQQLSVNVDATVPRFVVGDDQRLAQVITNLLSNAIKFTPENGKIHLNASLVKEVDGICTLRIEVIDTGIGISPEQHEKLFQSFAQAESGTSREFGGTGLGLAISKRIVELMDGKIWIESELNKGSRLIFTVDVARSEKHIRSTLSSGINWNNVRVLTVDDEEAVRNHFRNLFELINVRCDLASNGLEAWHMIEANGDYDVYFIDWKLPGIDGLELTRRIKGREGSKHSVVTMISSVDWTAIKEKALSAGVDRYLLKPLFSSAIIDCVNECMGMGCARVSQAAEAQPKSLFDGKRLLLAEDVEINREILISLLEDTKLVIDCAENGKEALDMIMAAPEKYDLVFMDVQMPQMDGLEATRHIRALPDAKAQSLPIIAMTANVFKDDINACLEAGMDGHIGKPLDLDEVYVQLYKYLGGIEVSSV